MKKVTLVIMIMLSTFIFTNYAFSGSNHQGMEASIGGFSNLGDSSYDFNWGNVGVFNRHDFNENWNLNLYATLGYLRWSSKTDKSDKDTFSVGAELVLYRRIYKGLSLGAGGGFSTLTNPTNLPDLGNSGLYGTGTVRLNYQVNKKQGIELSLDHISDAFQDCEDGDSGKNVFTLKFYYMFN